MSERLYILDAHSMIYQVFHGVDEMTAPDGRPTNAIFGFTRDLLNIRRSRKPDYFVAAFDAGDVTFRHQIDTQYKANRSEMPDDLRPQLPYIRQVLEAFRIPVLVQPGFEADDFLASVAVACSKRKVHAYLCTADKDCRQVIGPQVSLVDLRRNRILDAEFLLQDWGIRPEQVIDYQAMVGDSVDNVPGIPGVGAKTATKLLQQFGTLEEIIARVDEVPGAKVKENILKSKSLVMKSRELVRLKTDIPLPEDWSGWKLQTPDYVALEKLFVEFGFHRFLDEIRAEMPKTVAAAAEWRASYRPVTDAAGFARFLEELKSKPRFSFDLETTSINPVDADICGYAISWQPEEAWYVAVRAPAGETSLEPDAALAALKPVLEDPAVGKVGQNLKYDRIVLRAAGVDLRGIAFDSMVGSYLLDPGERIHNLDDLSMRLLGHKTIRIEELIGTAGKGKTQLGMNEVPVAKIAEYAGEDADVALRLTRIIEPELRGRGLGPLFDELELPLIDVLAEMEFHGIAIDAERLKTLSVEFGRRIEEIRSEAWRLAEGEFNLDSPIQLRDLLFGKLKLPIIRRTKTGPSTDQDVLEELADRHPVCEAILEYRKLAKLKSTYVDSLPLLRSTRTGRIHASFNQTVAATGRLSSSDPNLQNIPIRGDEGARIRQAFIARDEGHLLLSADYSQIELRFLAHFSGDAALKKAFLDGEDIHTSVASAISGLPADQVTSDLRRKAKAVNFGIMYGLSPFGLARQLKITQNEAADFIEAYFARYPGIDAFFTRVLEGAKRKGYVETMLGRRRAISGIRRTTGRSRNLPERTAINTVIQGSAADLIKRAMVNLHRAILRDHLPVRMLLQIHDELVFEVERSAVQSMARFITREMVSAMELDGVPLAVDVGVGPNWLDQETPGP
jgi:DNA polymerase-1